MSDTPLPPDDGSQPPASGAAFLSPSGAWSGRAVDDVAGALRTALGATHTVERELGGGGMSRVFVAMETALGRRVAIKVLAPELLQGVNAERFAREVALAARLQDPHIVPVLTTGATSDGLPYYTMPFIEGESLRERLQRGTLGTDEVVRILRDVAEALEYAHARGVVHRDIKPENVLLSGRNAVVADFGIAKAMSAARAAVPNGTLTSIGLSLGTPAYMAPEQAAGDEIDQRTDLYAWGMMAWELLAGRHPFAPRTQGAQLMAAQLTELPRPIEEVRADVPAWLAALVMRCVAKSPDDRPTDAAAVLAAFSGSTDPTVATAARPVATKGARSPRTLMVAGVVLAAVLGGGAWLASRRSADSSAARAAAIASPSVAVLPFEHQGDSADSYLTEGITDEIRSRLTGVPDLMVIARNSSVKYVGSNTPLEKVAKELGVRYVLTGTVRVLGTGADRRVLVRPELVEVMADGRLQSRGGTPVDEQVLDVVKVQGAVATQVVGSMQLAVGGADRAKLVEVPTRDAEAYDAYLRAMSITGGGGLFVAATAAKAIPLLERAVSRDSTLIGAYELLARSNVYMYAYVRPTPLYAQKARAALARLEALAPNSALTYRVRANVRRNMDADYPGALEDLRMARRIAPGDASVITAQAQTAMQLNQPLDALRDVDTALLLDPKNASIQNTRTTVLLLLGRVDDARRSAERAVSLAPSNVSLQGRRVQTSAIAGDVTAARTQIDEAAKDVSRDELLAWLSTFGDFYMVANEKDQRRIAEFDAHVFGDDTIAQFTIRAQLAASRRDTAELKRWASLSAGVLQRAIRAAPSDTEYRAYLSLMHAYAGRSAEALSVADEVMRNASKTISGTDRDLFLVLVRTAAVSGDKGRALRWLRELMVQPGLMTPARVRLTPELAPLLNDPEFEQILSQAKRAS